MWKLINVFTRVGAVWNTEAEVKIETLKQLITEIMSLDHSKTFHRFIAHHKLNSKKFKAYMNKDSIGPGILLLILNLTKNTCKRKHHALQYEYYFCIYVTRAMEPSWQQWKIVKGLKCRLCKFSTTFESKSFLH